MIRFPYAYFSPTLSSAGRLPGFRQGNGKGSGGSRISVVVIGNGMTSHRFCERLTELDRAGRFAIRVIGEEPQPAYDQVHLTDYLSHRDAARLTLAGREWYAERGIELITGERVTEIIRDERAVLTDAGRRITYDRLILATGSSPYAPPIEGCDSPGVFFYRTLEDLDAIGEAARSARRAVVVGGGLLGLEAARALQNLGLSVEILEVASLLMPRQLDDGAAGLLLEHVKAQGISVRLSAKIGAISPRAGKLLVGIDEELVETDLVVISAGIRPRDELARECGLDIAGRGGVLVDRRLFTSDPLVLAVGECASVGGTVFGLAGPGLRMAEVAAGRIAEGRGRFRDADLSARLKMLGVEVASIGEGLAAGDHYVYRDEKSYRRLVVQRGKLIGSMSVGEWDEAARLRDVISARRRFSRNALRRFSTSGRLLPQSEIRNAAQWPAAATVCSCRAVSRGELSEAISAGCTGIADLGRVTGAGTVCGSCKPLLGEMLGAPVGEAVASRPRALAVFSLIAISLVLAHLTLKPIPAVASVASALYEFEVIWRGNLFRQISGYTLLAAALSALALTARKRWKRFGFGSFGRWRAAHALIGALTLGVLFAHTGVRPGVNLNLALFVCFLAANLSGGAAGLITSLEGDFGWARRARRGLTLAHILLLWPLPLLIGLHIFAVYYF